MSHTSIPLYSGIVPNRTQSANDFADNGDDWLTYQAPLAANYNALAASVDNTAIQVDLDATAAAISADTATSAANFKGEWDTNPDGTPRTGSLNVPASVAHNDSTWELLSNVADVTAVEPSVDAVWQLIIPSSTWQDPKTANFNIIAGQSYLVDGSGGTVDGGLPATIVTKQEFIIHNESISTNLVRVLNPNFTIKGATGVLLAGDNLILEIGDTVHLVAKSSSILEVV